MSAVACTCPTCQHEHTPPPVVDMTGHDEALRALLHQQAAYLTEAAQAIEAALAGQTVTWPEYAADNERDFMRRYYPGEAVYSLYLPTVRSDAYIRTVRGDRKVIWSATGTEQEQDR